jgi:hypothetical protein
LGGGAGGHIIEGPVQGQSPTRRPMVAGIATAAHSGRRLANARRLRDAACTTGCGVFFKVFLYSFFYSFLRPFHVAWAWASWGGGVGCTVPHFLKLAPTLGSANSFKIHGEWRFHFFPKKVFPKFGPQLDLHIYGWDFCSMKNLIH